VHDGGISAGFVVLIILLILLTIAAAFFSYKFYESSRVIVIMENRIITFENTYANFKSLDDGTDLVTNEHTTL